MLFHPNDKTAQQNMKYYGKIGKKQYQVRNDANLYYLLINEILHLVELENEVLGMNKEVT